MSSGTTVWTIGHSTRTTEEFIDTLIAHRIAMLVDVRRFPTSQRYPHFDSSRLERSLAQAGIDYLCFRELGGHRQPRSDSANSAWRSKGFRGYADYMETNAFEHAIEQVVRVASDRPTAVMCAERLWWRCHRALIADYLKARSIHVIHIEDAEKTVVHPFTNAARIVDGRLSYRDS